MEIMRRVKPIFWNLCIFVGQRNHIKEVKTKKSIRFGEEESHIRMMVKKDELSYKIDMHLRKNKAKGVAINGLPIPEGE